MLTFGQQFNIIDTQNNEYKSQKRIYKYFRTFNEPFTCYEVYDFIKQNINYVINTIFNTCKTINVFAFQLNGVKHQIYYLSTDELGNTVKKEKYKENKDINPPFDIYIQVETINFPLKFTYNTPERALRPVFKFKREYIPRRYDGSTEKRLTFYTKRIECCNTQTKEGVYNLCIPFLTNFQTLYKNSTLNSNQITKSCYEISILTNDRENEALYYCELDSDGDYISEVKIYESLNEPRILRPYKIELTIYLIYDPSESQEDELDTQSEIEELEERLTNLQSNLELYQNKARTTNKCTREETCCICLTNPSNVILTDCGHICVCELCNKNIIDLKCPLCRTLITQPRLII